MCIGQDYFKTGLQFEKRVMEKQRQLKGDNDVASSPAIESVATAAALPGKDEPPLSSEHKHAVADDDSRPTKKVRVDGNGDTEPTMRR